MKALAALLLAPAIAYADVLFMPNRAGGEIVITDRPCVYQGKTFENMNEAYSWTHNFTIRGCWRFLDGNVHILYFDDATPRVYPAQAFRLRKDI